MKAGFRELAACAAVLLGLMPATPQAADAELIYDKRYQCGTEIIEVGHRRRDADRPDMPPPTDAQNYCQIYHHHLPKTKLGGAMFDAELRTDVEKRLRACEAIASSAPVAVPQPSGSSEATAAEYERARRSRSKRITRRRSSRSDARLQSIRTPWPATNWAKPGLNPAGTTKLPPLIAKPCDCSQDRRFTTATWRRVQRAEALPASRHRTERGAAARPLRRLCGQLAGQRRRRAPEVPGGGRVLSAGDRTAARRCRFSLKPQYHADKVAEVR